MQPIKTTKNILPQIKLIADMSAVKGRQEKDKEIIKTYEDLVTLIAEKMKYASHYTTALQPHIGGLEFYRDKEELLRHQESLTSKKYAADMLQARADQWEVQFEENSRIVNENFEEAVRIGHQRRNASETINQGMVLGELLKGYEKDPTAVLADQQVKNNLYYQIVDQLNTKKR